VCVCARARLCMCMCASRAHMCVLEFKVRELNLRNIIQIFSFYLIIYSILSQTVVRVNYSYNNFSKRISSSASQDICK